MKRIGYALQLVGIARRIDRDDAAIRDLQRGGLENIAALDGHKPRQAVDIAIAHKA